MLGYARPQDHIYWLTVATARVAYLDRAGTLVGYGYLDADGWMSPIATRDQLLTAAIVRDLLGRLPTPDQGGLSVFGSSRDLLASLLDAGARIDQTGSPAPYVYCSTDAARPEPSYVGYSAFLV